MRRRNTGGLRITQDKGHSNTEWIAEWHPLINFAVQIPHRCARGSWRATRHRPFPAARFAAPLLRGKLSRIQVAPCAFAPSANFSLRNPIQTADFSTRWFTPESIPQLKSSIVNADIRVSATITIATFVSSRKNAREPRHFSMWDAGRGIYSNGFRLGRDFAAPA